MAKVTTTEIKKLMKGGNVIVGTERVIKGLKLGNVSKVMLSSNCPQKVEEDINHYSGINKTEIQKLEFPNDELGIICKKPFSISVLALLKGAK
ncbi:MAG TPA: ribosomal L7Ae/L30e/S12e/Gadd45 family protein [Candidatus Nanoarchaeia archaeon]|nr:ribosomal L7Ae/L30e/S12e/Gadd45 family protein [Candidatus Nanoarchaeia archaeon]